MEFFVYFPIYFIFQLSWLGILAGILSARDKDKNGVGLLSKKTLLLTAVQFSTSAGLISLIICGQTASLPSPGNWQVKDWKAFCTLHAGLSGL